ncbi:MAG TPA: arginine--tRNA ligase [bacterium]|nr:arginine--tRNA ligase [bacterium]
MKIIEKHLEERQGKRIRALLPQAPLDKLFVTRTGDEQFGDYQTNFAMAAAKDLTMKPMDIAKRIVSEQGRSDLGELSIAGPGFINLTLSNDFIAEEVAKIGREPYDFSFLDRAGSVVIDYSSPNIAKPMHIGHLRSTVLGDSIARIYRYLGYTVVGDNHLGDWGTQFGKLIVAYRRWLDRAAYEKSAIEELERIYVLFSQATESDPSLEEEARAELKKLQDGDPENRKLWREFIDLSLAEYNRIYERMGVRFDTYHGESFFHDRMPAMLDLLIEKGLAKESEGALVVFFDEKEKLHPCIVRKGDGAFLYATSDLACLQFKRETYTLNRAVYVTDERQQPHFKQIFRIARMLGWQERLDHVWFGIMRFGDDTFSSRAGNVIKLDELLNEAVRRARIVIEEKNPELPEDEKAAVAEMVGLGAVKYADLSQNRISAVSFEWDKALSFDGNTAPYLQYTHARIRSIARKAAETGRPADPDAKIAITGPTERRLAVYLLGFGTVVQKAAENYRPNLIADYLFELGQRFNTFYNANPVLKENDAVMQSRLALCLRTAHVVKEGLSLLGIGAPERM